MSRYIHPNSVKAIRMTIRDMYPMTEGWRWSVTSMDDNVGVIVALMEFPKRYNFPRSAVIDHHNVERACADLDLGTAEATVLTIVGRTLMKTWKPNAFFPQFRIGSWNERAKPALK